jgi:5-methylcytosine-specific restriction enzyme A
MIDFILRFISELWYGTPESEGCADRGLRSSRWPTVRKAHLASEPKCQWCGTKYALEIHHIEPFHLRPELELEPKNLITLCQKPTTHCHIKRGHKGCWRDTNPTVREECERKQKGM